MDARIRDLLTSPDKQDRIKGIKVLSQEPSRETLNRLAVLHKRETDPDVRDLIIKAGRYVKKEMKAQDWRGSVDEDDTYDESNEDAAPKQYDVSAADEKRSLSLINQALTLNMRAMDDPKLQKRARAAVHKAYQMNPNLQYDSYHNGVAADILGVSPVDVPRYLMDDDYDLPAGADSEKAKRKRHIPDDMDANWNEALIDLLIYWIVITAVIVVTSLIGVKLIGDMIYMYEQEILSEESLNSFPSVDQPAEDLSLQDAATIAMPFVFFETFKSAGIIGTVIYGVFGGFFSMLSLLFYYFLNHIIATRLLGGIGSLPSLIHRTSFTFTLVFAFTSIITWVLMFVFINALASSGLDAAVGLYSITMLIGFVFSIALWFWYAQAIGRNYDFGTGKGCLTIIITALIPMFISCACSIILTMITGAAMTSLSTEFEMSSLLFT